MRHSRLIVRSAHVEGGFICGGCFFGGNEMSDDGESPICVSGFYRYFIRRFFDLPYADLFLAIVV